MTSRFSRGKRDPAAPLPIPTCAPLPDYSEFFPAYAEHRRTTPIHYSLSPIISNWVLSSVGVASPSGQRYQVEPLWRPISGFEGQKAEAPLYSPDTLFALCLAPWKTYE